MVLIQTEWSNVVQALEAKITEEIFRMVPTLFMLELLIKLEMRQKSFITHLKSVSVVLWYMCVLARFVVCCEVVYSGVSIFRMVPTLFMLELLIKLEMRQKSFITHLKSVSVVLWYMCVLARFVVCCEVVYSGVSI